MEVIYLLAKMLILLVLSNSTLQKTHLSTISKVTKGELNAFNGQMMTLASFQEELKELALCGDSMKSFRLKFKEVQTKNKTIQSSLLELRILKYQVYLTKVNQSSLYLLQPQIKLSKRQKLVQKNKTKMPSTLQERRSGGMRLASMYLSCNSSMEAKLSLQEFKNLRNLDLFKSLSIHLRKSQKFKPIHFLQKD